MKSVFFGGSEFSVYVLDELKSHNIVPALIITTPDKPKGRKLVLTPTPVKIWAQNNGIEVISPVSLKKDNADLISKLQTLNSKLFLVASYGKIIPQEILDIPPKGTLNVHPSLLPKLRGASPIKGAILSENETGVSIMLLDAEMDHGPIVAQEKVMSWNNNNPPYEKDLAEILGHKGGQMLAEILPDWLENKIEAKEQNHEEATFCGKIEKSYGEINLEDNPEKNLRKIRAYRQWPGAFYFIERNGRKMRINIKSAHIENGKLVLEKVVPEGKKEMSYEDFLRGQK
jgi:methionyl-tRNA formyltransferase